LDTARRAEILPFLDRLVAQLTLPMLYVTHAPEELTRLADHVLLLENGRVQAQGSLAELLTHPGLTQGEAAGVVIRCRVSSIDPQWHLARVEFPGGSLLVRDESYRPGQDLRVRLLARDLSLSTRPPQANSSIGNEFEGLLEQLRDDEHPATLIAQVRVGEIPMLARLTRQSADRLALACGQRVWVQVKTVAVAA
jgi:molybdate transport system ATP-binding protein